MPNQQRQSTESKKRDVLSYIIKTKTRNILWLIREKIPCLDIVGENLNELEVRNLDL